MSINDSRLAELQALVKEIKSGQRVVIFPPGLWAFLLAIFAAIVALVTCVGPMISLFAAGAEPSAKAGMQFGGLLALVVGVVFPSLMVFQGKKQFIGILRGFAAVLAVIALVVILLITSGVISAGMDYRPPLILSLVLSSTTFILAASVPYRLLSEFYFYLKQA